MHLRGVGVQVAVARAWVEDSAENPADPSSGYHDDPELASWLNVLAYGKPEQQAAARTQIGLILEARGFVNEAEEAYWTNVQNGAAEPRSYERLSEIYRERQDRLTETLVRRKFELVFGLRDAYAPEPENQAPLAFTPRPKTPTGAPPAQTPRRRPEPIRQALREPAPVLRPPVREFKGHPLSRIRWQEPWERAERRSRAQQRPEGRGERTAVTASLVAPAPVPQPRALRLRGARQDRGADLLNQDARTIPPVRHLSDAPEPRYTAPAPLALVSGQVRGSNKRNRRAAYSPNTARSQRGGGLIPLDPTTLGALLLTSLGAAALIAFMIVSFGHGGLIRPALAASDPVPDRCTDITTRFPGTNDPRAAVVAAYKVQGVDVDATRPGSARLTADQAEQVVGSWMAVSLWLEHDGQRAPTLAEWLDPDTDKPTLANEILSGRSLNTILSREDWADMRGWPTTTCEGAFVQSPRNAAAMRLMERVVAR